MPSKVPVITLSTAATWLRPTNTSIGEGDL